MQFQVYKHLGCQNHNIGDVIVDGNFIVSMEWGFQTSWMKTYDWCMVRKV
jgi:hypothetical protein